MKIFDDKQTELDLNGPVLSLTTDPTGSQVNNGGTAILIGIGTATFPTTANNTGIVTYRWYEQGVGAVSNNDGDDGSTIITGSATTTLTLENLVTPTDNQRKFYLEVDYIPSYYETGNANNEPFNSGIATITVNPTIDIIAQPTNVQALLNTNATIGFTVDLSDSYFTDDLTFQWFLDGEEISDGTVTSTTTTNSTTAAAIENTYTSPASISVPSSATNIELVLAGAQGGSGGYDAGGPGGAGAQGRAGRFSMPDGAKSLTFEIGNRGNGGTSGGHSAGGSAGTNPNSNASGGDGGGAGQEGWSGGGGGGGAASFLALDGSRILVAGGGGGGGGGSWNRSGDSGFGRNPGVGAEFEQSPSSLSSGGAGTTKNGDGGGGGGGGGGTPGGSGGGDGQDNSHGGEAGSGGGSYMDSSYVTQLNDGSGWLNEGDGYGYLKYTATTSAEVTTTRNNVVSGTTSNTLTIRSDVVGVQTCQCTISSDTAFPTTQKTVVVNFVTVSSIDQNNINIEVIGTTDTASNSSINLNNGEYTFEVEGTDTDNNGINQFYVLYSPDKDIDVEMDLYGGKGDDNGSKSGGEGGYSRIRFTMDKNVEYVIAGLINSVNTPFVYKKAALLACVGQGGAASATGNGGAGGGVDIGGQDGSSWEAVGGVTANQLPAQTIGGNGSFGSTYTAPVLYPGDLQESSNSGGYTIACTKGVYYAEQGQTPCEDIAESVKFLLSDGTEVSNTADINRGFKAGYNIMQTAGAGSNDGGSGGNGATGGKGSFLGGGGGGGSGWEDGSVTVVSKQQGGSTGDAKVVLRLQT